jgi:hypothetical protein
MPRPKPRSIELRHYGRTVLTYAKVEFVGDWEYFFDEYSFRPVGRSGGLLVVTEMPTGTLVTHFFIVRRRPDLPNGAVNTTDNVIVPKGENIVYVPERCAKKTIGDMTTCG